ncbi:hypothetical protein TNCT_722691, partial [Trichonephila clavata]
CSADTSETSRALGAASAPISDDGAIDADDGGIDADDGAVDADDSAIDADNDAIDADNDAIDADDDDEKEFKSFNTASTTADEYTTVNVSAASSNFPDPITLLTKTEPGEQIIIPINGVNHVVERFHSIVEPPTSVMGDPIITLLPPSFMRPRRRVAPPVLRINREVQTDEPSLNPRQQDNPPFSGRAQPMRPPSHQRQINNHLDFVIPDAIAQRNGCTRCERSGAVFHQYVSKHQEDGSMLSKQGKEGSTQHHTPS